MIDVRLLESVQTVSFSSGSTICREGDPAGRLFLIAKGSVSTFKNHGTESETRISTLGPGDFWGEMPLFLGRKQFMTAIASDAAEITIVDSEGAEAFFRDRPSIAFALMGALCKKVEASSQAYQRLYLQSRETAPKAAPKPVEKPVEKPAEKPPAPAKAPPAPPPEEPVSSGLFPPGHQTYSLPLVEPGSELWTKYMYDKSFTCPQCGKRFSAKAVRASKLLSDRADPDGRVHYKDVEPMYYEVVTCPQCGYSSLGDTFAEGMKKTEVVKNALKAFREELPLAKEGEPTTSLDVFAGYYMSILCAPICLVKSDLTQAKLWLKLSRIYADCGDEAMETMCTQKALEFYNRAYSMNDFPPRQLQQLYLIMGELYMKVGDYKNARGFFFRAKTEKQGAPTVKRQAEDRIEQLRELIGE